MVKWIHPWKMPYKQPDCPHHKTRVCASKKHIVSCESPIVFAGFMQQPTSDAHSSTYLISLNSDGIYMYVIYVFPYEWIDYHPPTRVYHFTQVVTWQNLLGITLVKPKPSNGTRCLPPSKGGQWRTLEGDGIVSKYFRWNTQWPYGFSKTRLPIIGHTANLGLPYRNASTSSWIISTQTSIWLWNDIWVQQLQNMQTEAVITEDEHQIKQVYNFTLQSQGNG